MNTKLHSLYIPAPDGLYNIKAAQNIINHAYRSMSLRSDYPELLTLLDTTREFVNSVAENRNHQLCPGYGMLTDVCGGLSDFRLRGTIHFNNAQQFVRCPKGWGVDDCPFMIRESDSPDSNMVRFFGLLQGVYLSRSIFGIATDDVTDEVSFIIQPHSRNAHELERMGQWLAREFSVVAC